MTWAEFKIRLHGYKRIELNELKKHREILWTIYTAPYNDPKQMARSMNKFYPINGDDKLPDKVLELIKERSNLVKEKYLKDKNG